jgi:TonB-dependent Receptor Plug Domain
VRVPILALLVGALALSSAGPLRAQDTSLVRRDSLKADSLKRADTLSTTDRLLKAQKDQHVQLRPLPLCGVSSVQPAGARVVFTRDSIDWAAAESVAELLQRVPGVFLEQSDWLGSAQLPNVFGRGAASIEYALDCVPMLRLGVDSVAFDPSVMPLDFLDRVEVETGPGLTRVLLFTRRHDRAAPRTKIGVSQGDRSASRYLGMFERRYTSGVGLGIGAEYAGINAPTGGTGGNTIGSGWFQLGYAPSARFGIQAQLMTNVISRNLLLDGVTLDTLTRQVDGSRTDVQVRAAFRQRADGLGRSLDLFYAHSAWTSDSAPGNQGIAGVGVVGAIRQPTWSAQLSTWHFSKQTPLDSRLDLGWTPIDRLSGALELVSQHHDGDRESQWATARAGLKLPLGFRLSGSVSNGHRVQAPALATDVAQQFTDAQLTGAFESKLLSVEAGFLSNEGWRPLAYPVFVAIASLGPQVRTGWATAHVRIAPVGFFTLESVYYNPVSGGAPDASPPRHMLSTATIRSRFLRNFPSGIFDLKIQAVLESWAAGFGGRDTLGVGIPLPAATFFRGIFQMQIGPFIVYYDKANLQATRTGYVPGYPIQPVGSTFGIRWEFSN